MTKLQLPQDPTIIEGCVSYAQIREDLILESFFPEVKKGFYVDVGAFDPDIDSVTKLFYLKGWRGINFEPQKGQFERFVALRPRDTNLQVGISDKAAELTLRSYNSMGLATFSQDVKEEYEKAPTAETKDYQEFTVPVRPLRDVLREQKVTHIHFMKVDVESLEYEVLISNDWERFRPEVLCIEANHVRRDWRKVLQAAEYELAFNDGLNEYYTDSRTDRKSKFDYVQHVIIERGGGIRAEHYAIMVAWRDFGTDKARHVEDLARANQALLEKWHVADRELTQLRQENESIKSTVRRLHALVAHKFKAKRK